MRRGSERSGWGCDRRCEKKGRKNASGERVMKKKVEKMRRESFIYIYIIEVRVTGAVDGSGFELRVN